MDTTSINRKQRMQICQEHLAKLGSAHVNMKRKIDALKHDLTIKRVSTQWKTFYRRMQTRFDIRPIDMRLKMF